MELFLSFAKVLKSLVSIYFFAPNLKYLSIYLLCCLSNNLGINLLTFIPFKSDILYLKIFSIFILQCLIIPSFPTSPSAMIIPVSLLNNLK